MKGASVNPLPSSRHRSAVTNSLSNRGSYVLHRPLAWHVAVDEHDRENSSQLKRQECDKEQQCRLVKLGEKTGQLVHDIRNPLSSIEWFASLLGQDHHSREERQHWSEQCIQAVRCLDQLVSNVLVFSSSLNPQQDSVNVIKILDDVELLLAYPLRKKRVTVHREHVGSLPLMLGYELLLKQALFNLLANAVQASELDGVIDITCAVETRVSQERGCQRTQTGMVIRIQDYGCGMSEEDCSQMFHPFFTRTKGGTGLGLSIVKQVVQLHRGLIDVMSQQERGTIVDLFIPV